MIKLALVTGAAGFIGRHVCRTLSRSGFNVRAIGHGMEAEEAACWGVSTCLDAEVRGDALAEILDGEIPDAVIHCAGSASVAYSYSEPYQDFSRSVTTVAALLEFVRASCRNEPRIVLTSSAAVYGDQGDVDLTETSSCSPMSPYGFNKLTAESIATSYSRFFGANVSIVRLFSVYGEGLRKQLLWDAANKFSRVDTTFHGTGEELRDWIHVEDAASLLCAAAAQPQGPLEIYTGGNFKASTRDVLLGLAERLDVMEPLRFTGLMHVGNPRRLTTDSSYARRRLDWSPHVSLGEGLDRYCAWLSTLDK